MTYKNNRLIHRGMLLLLLLGVAATLGFNSRKNLTDMPSQFIEITVQHHLVSHGFDENNKEIIEEITVEQPMKKFLSVDRIQSVSEKYLLTTYGHGRLVYWEYEGTYEELKEKIRQANASR